MRLSSTVHILSLIIRRNKNQHRNQFFWRHLCLLNRHLKKLLALYQSLSLSSHKQPPTTNSPQNLSAENIRSRFEEESKLRSEKEYLQEYVREVLVPKCYISFSGVVADSQFANLGVVLMGITADVAGIVGMMKKTKIPDLDAKIAKQNPTTQKTDGGITRENSLRIFGTSTKVTGEDQGEIVRRIYDSSGPLDSNHDDDKIINDGKKKSENSNNNDNDNADVADDIDTGVKMERETVEARVQNREQPTKSRKSENDDGGGGKRSAAAKKSSKRKRGAFDDLFKDLV